MVERYHFCGGWASVVASFDKLRMSGKVNQDERYVRGAG